MKMIFPRRFHYFLSLGLISILSTPACLAESGKTGNGETPEVNATDSKTGKSESSSVVDAEKQKVIDALLETTDLSSRVEIIKNAFYRSAIKAFALSASRAVQSEPGSAEVEKQKIIETITARSKKMSERYKELFDKEIDLDSSINEIASRVYSKHFTTAELQDILDFYKTPTGQKAREVMPIVARESLQETRKELGPKLKSLVERVLEESESGEHESAKAESN